MARKQAKQEEAKRQLYLHVEHHPQGPKSSEVQKLFNDTFLNPPGKKPFNQIGRYGELPVDKLVDCMPPQTTELGKPPILQENLQTEGASNLIIS